MKEPEMLDPAMVDIGAIEKEGCLFVQVITYDIDSEVIDIVHVGPMLDEKQQQRYIAELIAEIEKQGAVMAPYSRNEIN